MATEASRATCLRERPSFAAPAGSLAATAAAVPVSHKPDHSFAAAWAEVWTASGGMIRQSGDGLMILSPVNPDKVDVPAVPGVHLSFQCPSEQQGALNALQAVVHRAGSKALRSLFLNEPDALEADWAIIREGYRADIELATDITDPAHDRILVARPTTTRGAIIQLLVGLLHEHGVAVRGIDFEAAILAEDYASLSSWEEEGRLDWGPRFTVRALCTLAAMEADNG